jgi:carbon storage regulator
MLVIARKAGERICLGDDTVVTVLEIVGSTVRLGVEAPAEVAVYRYEVRAAIEEENRAAAAAAAAVEDLPGRTPPASAEQRGVTEG